MNCPYCQSEMQRGYMQSRDGLFWTKKEALIPAITPLFSKGSVALTNENPFDNHTVVAYRCEKCETVLIPSKTEKE